MCDYCENHKKILIDKDGLLLLIKKNLLYAVWDAAFGGYPTASKSINYCPICGRKLEE